MVLAHSVDGRALKPDQGILRVAFVGPKAQQVTNSGKWTSQVIEIVAQ